MAKHCLPLQIAILKNRPFALLLILLPSRLSLSALEFHQINPSLIKIMAGSRACWNQFTAGTEFHQSPKEIPYLIWNYYNTY